MKYQLLVFDWDGTLYDSGANIVASLQQAAKDFQLAVPSEKAIRGAIGLSFDEALKQAFPHLPLTQKEGFAIRYREYINSETLAAPGLFPGVPEVLSQLSEAGFELAVATSKNRQWLDKDMVKHGVSHYFKMTRCADEAFSKPNPKMLFDIMGALSVTPEKVLMIGDTEYDLLFAAGAGVEALAVCYGVHSKERLMKHHPKGYLNEIKELPAWLDR